MTIASPTDAGMPGDVGLPSELHEVVKAALPDIAIAIEEWLFNGAADDQAASDIADLIRPAVEAKEQEIEELKGKLAVRMEYLVGLAMTADKYACAAAERRALSAEAKLAQAVGDEREQAITAYASHIDVALREYSDNLSYGDDALGPEFFIERGMEAAASAIRARSASRGETE